eukprot:4881356-Ditylum_brightwellii.AAC.1
MVIIPIRTQSNIEMSSKFIPSCENSTDKYSEGSKWIRLESKGLENDFKYNSVNSWLKIQDQLRSNL